MKSRFKVLLGMASYVSFFLMASGASSAPAWDQIWDQEIQAAKQAKKVGALEAPHPESEPLIRLGQVLFVDPKLSGSQDISCVHCHHPRLATMDGLPFSIGTGGKGVGPNRLQRTAELTRRNSLALLNVGLSLATPMFWDGRVEFSPRSHSFFTPEPALNGYHPLHPERRHPVAVALDSSLAAQALFPLVDAHEMMGPPGSNEIADAPNRLEAWERIMKRVKGEKHYRELFTDAYPSLKFEDANIGHVGSAIAAFERQAFVANQTPWDRYLRGDLQALSSRQKQGAALFVGKARCVECHAGPELTRYDFFTTGVPQQGVAVAGGLPADDLGRMEVETDPWFKPKWRYSFRAPPLRNVALTAPYMHDGVFTNLRQVIEHYSDPIQSVSRPFTPAKPSGYTRPLVSDAGSSRALERLKFLDERMALKAPLTELEIDALVDFLEHALTDPAYLPQAAHPPRRQVVFQGGFAR